MFQYSLLCWHKINIYPIKFISFSYYDHLHKISQEDSKKCALLIPDRNSTTNFFLILHKRKIKGLSEFGLNFTLERILSEEEKNTNFYSTNYAWYALCLRPDLSHNALKNYRISTDSIQNKILGLFLYERGGRAPGRDLLFQFLENPFT